MPDYGEILTFLANNPPQLTAERQLHASLLELLANCLRTQEEEQSPSAEPTDRELDERHVRWVNFN